MGIRTRKSSVKLRIYCDTSVFGGCFDSAFALDSLRVIRLARDGEFVLIISQPVLEEVRAAPDHVRDLIESIPKSALDVVALTPEIVALQQQCLKRGVLGPRWATDALHVAAATLAHADAKISWNFKHIVRLDRIKAFNAINLELGYNYLTVISPKEVREYGQED